MQLLFFQVSVFVSRTWQKKQGLIAGGIVAAVHMLFLFYLHFAYHEENTGTVYMLITF